MAGGDLSPPFKGGNMGVMPYDTKTGEFTWTQAGSLREAVEQAVNDLNAIAFPMSSKQGEEVSKIADYLAQHLA